MFFSFDVNPKNLLTIESKGISWLFKIDKRNIRLKLNLPDFFHTRDSEMCFVSWMLSYEYSWHVCQDSHTANIIDNIWRVTQERNHMNVAIVRCLYQGILILDNIWIYIMARNQHTVFIVACHFQKLLL